MAEKIMLRSIDEIAHNGKPLREIIDAHRIWLESDTKKGAQASLVRADLRFCDMQAVNLSGAELSEAEIFGTNLKGSSMVKTYLIGANIKGCNLESANLRSAFMVGTNMDLVNLDNADLQEAFLYQAKLHSLRLNKANMNRCYFGHTVITDCDLSNATGIDTIQHRLPSSLGVDTILQSKGKIPEVFLKGVGLPDIWVQYVRSLVTNPLEFYTCFISYSAKDQEFSDRLYADLQGKNVRCWYFPEDATWGKPIWGEIDRAVKVYDKLVVVCSEHSLNSVPVIREIERALQREDREKREILFPIRIDDYLFEKWDHPRKADVVAKVVGDFRGWKDHEQYKKNFPKLLKALNSKQPS